jgi:hypothetical protein
MQTLTLDPLPKTKTGKPIHPNRIANLQTNPQANRITSANAAEMARRGHELRRQRKAAMFERLLHPVETDNFAKQSLQALQAHILKLDLRIAAAKKPEMITALATARGKLADQEAQLAGRSRPRTKGNAATAAPMIQAED